MTLLIKPIDLQGVKIDQRKSRKSDLGAGCALGCSEVTKATVPCLLKGGFRYPEMAHRYTKVREEAPPAGAITNDYSPDLQFILDYSMVTVGLKLCFL